jgi:hypothetical protein
MMQPLEQRAHLQLVSLALLASIELPAAAVLGATFRAPQAIPIESSSSAVDAVDLNGDAWPDLAVALGSLAKAAVLLNDSGESFLEPRSFEVGLNPVEILVADLDGDLDLDLLTVNSGSSSVSALLNRGDGTFLPAVESPATWSVRTAALGDLNADGFPDIAMNDFRADNRGRIAVALTDAVRILLYLFQGGERPPAPGPETCGEDPTADGLLECTRTPIRPGKVAYQRNGLEIAATSGAFPLPDAEDLRFAPAIVDEGGVKYPGLGFVRGDSNADGAVNLSDAIRTLAYLFQGGPVPDCLDAADSHDSGLLDISDPIYLLGVLFLGHGAIPPPYPECDCDRTEDSLRCKMARCPG